MEYLPPSNVGAFYAKHVAAMAPCKDQPQGTSFAIPLEGFNCQCLRDIAETYNVGKLAYVVIEHSTGYEVQRLEDGSNTKLFYRYLINEGSKAVHVSTPIEVLLLTVEAYGKADSFEAFAKYDANLTHAMKQDNVFPYALMQRKLASNSALKNSRVGATEALKKAFDELVEYGYISDVPTEEAKAKYQTNAKLYRIVKENQK